jgi:peroxiredoxin
MKKMALIISLLMAGFVSQAQTDSITIDTATLAPYLKTRAIPDFKILLTDKTLYSKNDLPKRTAVVVIYFSPDCGHCQIQVKDIMDSMQYFKKVFFVLAASTTKKIADIKEFSKTYNLADAKNVRVGKEFTYMLPTFYAIQFTPFVAVYDKDGNFLKAFPQGAKIEELRALF